MRCVALRLGSETPVGTYSDPTVVDWAPLLDTQKVLNLVRCSMRCLATGLLNPVSAHNRT
jgi:hypothetical protein